MLVQIQRKAPRAMLVLQRLASILGFGFAGKREALFACV